MHKKNKKVNEIIDRVDSVLKGILSKVYEAGFSDGSLDCRNIYAKSGLLHVDTDKMAKALVDPCEKCKKNIHRSVGGIAVCGCNICVRKQKHLLAMEINKYFSKNN